MGHEARVRAHVTYDRSLIRHERMGISFAKLYIRGGGVGTESSSKQEAIRVLLAVNRDRSRMLALSTCTKERPLSRTPLWKLTSEEGSFKT